MFELSFIIFMSLIKCQSPTSLHCLVSQNVQNSHLHNPSNPVFQTLWNFKDCSSFLKKCGNYYLKLFGSFLQTIGIQFLKLLKLSTRFVLQLQVFRKRGFKIEVNQKNVKQDIQSTEILQFSVTFLETEVFQILVDFQISFVIFLAKCYQSPVCKINQIYP